MSNVVNVQCGQCPMRSMSNVINVQCGQCPLQSMSTVVNVQCGQFPMWSMSNMVNVQCGQCTMWSMSNRVNVRCGQCPMWSMSNMVNAPQDSGSILGTLLRGQFFHTALWICHCRFHSIALPIQLMIVIEMVYLNYWVHHLCWVLTNIPSKRAINRLWLRINRVECSTMKYRAYQKKCRFLPLIVVRRNTFFGTPCRTE